MADTALTQALDNYGLTSFSNLLKPVGMPQGAPGLPPVYADASAPMTLFVPPNDAVDSIISPNTPGIAWFTDTRAFVAYHAAPGKWSFDPSSAAHEVIKTGLYPYDPALAEAVSLENNTAQSLVAVTTADTTGGTKTAFVNQKANIIDSKPEDPTHAFKIYVLDQALSIPPSYDSYATTNTDVGLFHQLMEDAFAFNVSLIQGFTAFVPTGDPNWTHVAQSRYPYQPLLASFFNNHVIPFHTIYSPQFAENSYASASQWVYHFDHDAAADQWTVELNGIRANVTAADIALADGVVHFIDRPFWNLDNSSVTSSASVTTPTSTQRVPSSHTSLPEDFPSSRQLSPGIIAAIIIPIVAILVLLCVGGYFYWRYHRTIGVRELARRREGLDGSNASVTPAALRTSPFVSSLDVAASSAGATSTVSPNFVPGVISSEKRGSGKTEHTVANATSDVDFRGGRIATSSTMPQMTEETAQRLLQVLSQRMGPGVPPPSDLPEDSTSERPPEYGV